jgi:hypothetical protein
MAPQGICRKTKGWGTQDCVIVEYDGGDRLEIPEDQYRQQNYDPPFDELPECGALDS